ncbi:hypothetical protein [Kocuria sp.]|uniref:hypothetical protein n=1 Tax=Kocuria sp. TaxID=1871328 RepID=UPI0026E0FE8B|nr:hypothetical protein [Kocuria sp.]MDO5618020.1 hypothetical protein [Kocuria sp.]
MAITIPTTNVLLHKDGAEIEHHNVKLLPIDQLMFEQKARVLGWGTLEDNPLRFLFFCTWHSLTRTGDYSETFDDFIAQAQAVTESDPDPEPTATEADPTRQDH